MQSRNIAKRLPPASDLDIGALRIFVAVARLAVLSAVERPLG